MKNNVKEKEGCKIKKILDNVKILSPEEAMENVKVFLQKIEKIYLYYRLYLD